MKTVTVETLVERDVKHVWQRWTGPEHIVNWNFASQEWHCSSAEQDLEVGGDLNYKMAAKDGSMSFDYTGTFTRINPNELLEYKLADGRKVSVAFQEQDGATKVVESFEVEDENTIEMQRQGWQAILNNFKEYAESK